jgi:hypothetical protein
MRPWVGFLGLLLAGCVGIRGSNLSGADLDKAILKSGVLSKPVSEKIAFTRGTRKDQIRIQLSARGALPDTPLDVTWAANTGTFSSTRGLEVIWTRSGELPASPTSVPLTVTVKDPAGDQISTTILVLVLPSGAVVEKNHPPVVTGIRAQSDGDGGITLTASATDQDDEPLTFRWLALRGRVVGFGATIRWLPVTSTPPEEAIRVEATDASGETSSGTLFFRVDAQGRVDLVPGLVLPAPVTAPELVRADLDPDTLPEVREVAIVSPARPRVDAPDSDGVLEAGFTREVALQARVTLADGKSNPWVVWTSSRPESLDIDWRGVARARPGVASGSVEVTARSWYDATRAATVSVQIDARGAMSVEVR